MGTTLVKRPARIAPPRADSDEIVVADPPKQQQPAPAMVGVSMILMPILSSGGYLMVAMTNQGRPLFAVVGLLFLVGSVAIGAVMIIGQRSAPRRVLREARERYLDYMEDLRRQLRTTIARQKAGAAWRHPEPEALLDVGRMQQRRWERRIGDEDFLVLRAGTGDQPVATSLVMKSDVGPLNEFDPVCLESARQLQARYSTLHDQPVGIDLRSVGVLSIVGDRDRGRRLASAMVLQLAAFHAPDEVRLGLVRAEQRAEAWEWVKWLPHVEHHVEQDGAVPARLITASAPAMAELLEPEIEGRLDAHQRRRGQEHPILQHLVIVVDGEHLSSGWSLMPPDPAVSLGELGIHVVLLLGSRREEPERVDARMVVEPSGVATQEWTGWKLRTDEVVGGLPVALARQIAALRLVVDEAEERLTHTVALPEVLGVRDVANLESKRTWQPRPLREFLRVPVGVGADGRPVMLDLKESAHGGMGPHGLIVGATGSGKSEMLRTMIASLAINHPPDRLALMLVDFKGGATFAPMAALPHLAGMITNLEDDLSLVDRMKDALGGEMRRRQEVLKDVGNLPNVTAYQALREQGQSLDPLPHLLVVIDEFSELLAAKPDFAELFVAIGRIGRSIGVHLLLATQRLEMGKIRGLESHLSYRIGLRTFSESESREVIGTPDAYHLPPEPGSGYLKVDTTIFERFKAALVSAPYTPPTDAPRVHLPVLAYLGGPDGPDGQVVLPDGSGADEPSPAASATAPPRQRSVLDVVVDRLSGGETSRPRPVWLDPLPELIELDRLQDPAERGAAGTVSAVLGLVDDPARQRQFPLEWDGSGAAGNLLVVAAPQAGKSTLLRTLVMSMAVRYSPGDVAFYCIDYGGGGLGPLEDLPHVAGVASRMDAERVSRTVHEVAAALDGRERLFREHGLHSAAALRAARSAGKVPAEVPGDVFLVIDGWGTFREEHEMLEQAVGDIAARGLNYGVHVILTATQTMQVRLRMQPSFGGRVELRLNDAFDSAVNRKAQERLPKDVPGRGLVEDGLVFQAATVTAHREMVGRVTARWPGRPVAAVRVLPPVYHHRELPPVEPGSTGVPVGLAERSMAAVGIDLFGADPHLRIFGDGQTGKTNLLRVLLRGYLGLLPPAELAVVVVDYRRSLLDVVPKEYLLAYCTNQRQAAGVVAEVAASLAARVPSQNVTPDQLRNRSWWTGMEVLVVVDDYDLVATSTGNPLLPLVDSLAQARDLGFHVVLARRTGGMARAMFEPLIQRLNDLSTPGFLFSGERLEGKLINGVASQRLPTGRALFARRSGGAELIQTALLGDDD